MHPLFLVSALLAAPASAQDVLVPEFTPAIQDDFTLAYMFYSLVVDELRDRSVSVVDGDSLRSMAGSDAEACGESITCPSALWDYYPDATIALVGVVGLYNAGTAQESIEIRVEFFERNGFQPLKTVERTMIPGQEADFAVALARATSVLAERLTPEPPPPEPTTAQTAGDSQEAGLGGLLSRFRRTKPEEEEAPAELHGEDTLYKSYYDVEEEQPERGRKEREPKKREPRNTVSTRPPRERASSAGGDHQLLHAQAFVGLAFGDVGRSYDVRISVMGSTSSPLGRYEHDAFTKGVGATFGVGLEASPWPWARAGLRLGLVTGRKQLSSGYELWSGGELTTSDVQEYKPAAAMRALIEPRVAIMPVELAGIRPMAVAFFDFRRYDSYEVQDLTSLDFPNRAGGWMLGPGLGLGARYDLGSGRALQVEVDHTWRIGSNATHHVMQGLITEVPDVPDTARGNTTISVGFTQGFL